MLRPPLLSTLLLYKHLTSTTFALMQALGLNLVNLNIPKVVGSGFALPDHNSEHALLHPT